GGGVGKCREVVREVGPGITRVALLWQPPAFAEAQGKALLAAAEVAAQTLRVRLQVVEAGGPGDFDRAFSEMTKGRAEALAVLTNATFGKGRRHLVELAAKSRRPAIYPFT